MNELLKNLILKNTNAQERESKLYISLEYIKSLLSEDDLLGILDSEDPKDYLVQILYDKYDSDIYYMYDELFTLLQEDVTMEEFSNFADEKIYFDYPIEDYLNEIYNVNIIVDTGDGNYEFTLNHLFPSYGGEKDDVPEKASLLWFANQQGYNKEDLIRSLNGEEISSFLSSIRNELENTTTSINMLTFLVKLSLRDLIKLNLSIKEQKRNGYKYDASENPDCGYIEISKNVSIGLYDGYNGAGGMFDIIPEKNIILPIKFIEFALPDKCKSTVTYSVDEVYGFTDDIWMDSVVKIVTTEEEKEEYFEKEEKKEKMLDNMSQKNYYQSKFQ